MFYELLGPYCVNKSTWKKNKRPKCQFPCHLFKQLCLKMIFFKMILITVIKFFILLSHVCVGHMITNRFFPWRTFISAVWGYVHVFMLCCVCLACLQVIIFLVYSVLILLEYGVDVWSLFQLFLEKWQYERNSP